MIRLMPVTIDLPRIQKLSANVANQIAAGEVIERPASVVKELVENSIDAAATRIQIDITRSGIESMTVSDNGQGIHKDDLKLALQPHATSKLSEFSDLSQIASLGFRGEALPSIASVSHFTLTTRMQGDTAAWSVDQDLHIKPAARAQGTTVAVEDLFHATPARRKFLKSDKTELMHIQSIVKSMALANSSVAFSFRHNDSSIFNFPACPEMQERRVLDVCGKGFINNSIHLETERDGMRLWGWLGLNEAARSQSDRQYFFVNGRAVQDKHVNHAIRLAYADRIAKGRFASYILCLQLNPEQLDINVHPAKSEVRFADTRSVHDFIYAGLMSELTQQNKTSELFAATDLATVNPAVIAEFASEYRTSARQQPPASYKNEKSACQYLIVGEGRFIVIDWQAEQLLIEIAASRNLLTGDYLLNHYESNTVTQRPILVPLSCSLKPQQMETVSICHTEIRRWGFDIEQVSPTQVRIRAIPARLLYADAFAMLKDLIDEVAQQSDAHTIAQTLASHVNDAGQEIVKDEIETLVKDIYQYEDAHPDKISLPWRRLSAPDLAQFIARR